MAEGFCDNRYEYTDSNIRCLKCVSVIIRVFPTIMHRIMDDSGTTPQSLYQRIQKDTQFRKNLKSDEHQVLQTLLTDGYDKLDLTLSFKIITHYSNMFINPPTRGWSSIPGPTEVTIGDDVQRLRLIRNQYLHKVEIELSEYEFGAFFTDTSSICERIDTHLNCTESFKTCIENMKTKQLIGTNELYKLYEEEKTLKEFFLIQIGRNEFKVYVAKSLSSFLQQLKEKEQDEGGFVPVNLTFPKISNRDLLRVMNDLREEINKDQVNLIIDNFKEGSFVLDLRIKAAFVMDDKLFRNEIKLLLMRLYKPIRTALDSYANVEVVLSESLAVFSDDIKEDDKEEENRLNLEGSLQLNLKVKKKIIESKENLKSELKTLLESIVSKSIGSEIFPVDKPVVSIMEPGTEDEKPFQEAISTPIKEVKPFKEAMSTPPKNEKPYKEAQVVTKVIKDNLEKPYMSENKSDEIVLQWSSTKQLKDTEVYSIMYKEHPGGKWRIYHTKDVCTQPKTTIKGLKPNTSYIFKVRVLDESTGSESSYTQESDPITTKTSPALHLLANCEQITVGPPSVYRLPIMENIMARNENAKTRKFTLGNIRSITEKERTILIVGATGCGKSTLIDAMANYILGVKWEDPFRFTLINLENSEKERTGNEALSQTAWVTCYTIYNTISDRIDYTINLIDTPGFGDSRGSIQDDIIIDQIRQLFTAEGEKGVSTLDAVCFILKAPDARLTATQRYIFESILALFGNDIKDNICTLITFADGQRPPCLYSIQAIDDVPLPYQTYFTFNNSALFVNSGDDNILSFFFWDMGIRSCDTFFDHIKKLTTRSLSLTSEVLIKREALENTIRNLQQEIEVGLSKINLLEKEIKIFTENAEAILANQDFEYTVEEQYQEKIDRTGKGQYTTNCLQCNYTCHADCAYANDNDKEKCCAMNSDGHCNECPSACHWTSHHNTPYIIKWSKKKVQKRYDHMKKKYEDATQKSLSQEQVLEQMDKDVSQIEMHVQAMMENITDLNNRLKEIALRPNPLSTVQYIELMIQGELREKKSGFENRIASLEKCKMRVQYGEHVQIFKDRIQTTRQSILPSNLSDRTSEDKITQ